MQPTCGNIKSLSSISCQHEQAEMTTLPEWLHFPAGGEIHIYAGRQHSKSTSKQLDVSKLGQIMANHVAEEQRSGRCTGEITGSKEDSHACGAVRSIESAGEGNGEDALSNTGNTEAQPIDWYLAGNNTTK